MIIAAWFTAALAADAEPVGDLAVTTTPGGARLWIDGADSTLDSPASIKGLATGEHWLTLASPCGRVDQPFTVASGAVTVIDVALPAGRGIVTITPSPKDATVTVNDAPYPGGAGGVMLACGWYTVKVSAPGYVPSEQRVGVEPNGVQPVDVELALVPVPVPAEPEAPRHHSVALAALPGAAAVGLAAVSALTFASASRHYQDYLVEPDDDVANTLYDEEVAPRRTAAIALGAGAGLLGAASLGVALTADTTLHLGPTSLGLTARW